MPIEVKTSDKSPSNTERRDPSDVSSVAKPRRGLRKILHEPLVHFFTLGALLFLFFQWTGGGSGTASKHIVITHAEIEHLAVTFARTWDRPPTEAELKGLIDDYVKEEIATREGISMGLDRDDVIIRRRLRQKLEFLSEGETASPATDAELQTWMTNHPGTYRTEPKVAFRQVYVSAEKRGDAAKADAEKLLARLRSAGPRASIDHMGDATMLPAEQPLAPLFDTARVFGDDFAQRLTKLEVGQWTGPVESSFGLHLVLITDRVDAAQATLADARAAVERDFVADRKKKELQSLYDKLAEKYTVRIEQPAQVTQGGGAAR
jgi:hypothetical protein